LIYMILLDLYDILSPIWIAGPDYSILLTVSWWQHRIIRSGKPVVIELVWAGWGVWIGVLGGWGYLTKERPAHTTNHANLV
jgi:hypothetical protein